MTADEPNLVIVDEVWALESDPAIRAELAEIVRRGRVDNYVRSFLVHDPNPPTRKEN